MSKKALCIQTFVEIIKSKVNVKINGKNFRTNIHVYQFLFDALVSVLESETDIEAPYIDKTTVSNIGNCKIDAPMYYIELSQLKGMNKKIGGFFANTLCAPEFMSKLAVKNVVNELFNLIEYDDSVSESTKAHFKKLVKNLLPADFIAEVWLFTIQNNHKHVVGKNKKTAKTIESEIDTTEIAVDTVRVVTLSRPLQPSDFFRGRNEQLDKVRELLVGNAKLTLLNGMGGIGKTEFCRKLFYEYLNGSVTEVTKIGWVIFSQSIEHTFFKQFIDMDIEVDTPAEYLVHVMRYLNELGSSFLLFIDNANEISEQDAALLSQLNCKVILTSRKRRIERIQGIEIGKLSLDDCRILYRQHSEEYTYHEDYNYGVTYEEDASPNEDLDAIITMADRHTLGIELLAKTQKSAAYNTSEMRSILEKTGFNLSVISESITYVHTPEVGDWERQEQVFIEQFSKVFDISNIKSEKLRVLQLFSLLSVDTIASKYVREWFDIDDLDTVNILVSQGWVFRGCTGVSRDVAFSMHPLISSVVQHKAKPEFDTAMPLAVGLADELYYDDTDLFKNRIQHINHAISLVHKSIGACDEYFTLINSICVILDQMGEYKQSLELLSNAIEVELGDAEIDVRIVSGLYHNLASCHRQLGLLNESKENFEIAVELIESYPEVEKDALATSYDCLGGTLDLLGEYTQAIKNFKKALKLRIDEHGKEHPKIAISYNNFGYVYDNIGEYMKARNYYKKALKIQEALLPFEHPDTMITDNNLGLTFKNLGDYKSALKHFKKAYERGEISLGVNHPDMLPVRDNIADLNLETGKFELAEKEFSELLQIKIDLYGKHHPDVATNLQSLGVLYFQISELPRALECFDEALEIVKKVFENDEHIEVAKIEKNIADVYASVDGMEQEALELYEKVLRIDIREFGERSLFAAVGHNNVGVQLADMGNHLEARKHYEIALSIQEENLTRRHPDVGNTLYNIGRTFDADKEYETALEKFIEAHDIITSCFEDEVPDLAIISEGLGNCYYHLRDYNNSDKWFKQSIRIYQEMHGSSFMNLVTAHYVFAESLADRGLNAEAIAEYQNALRIIELYQEENSEFIEKLKKKIRELSAGE